MSGKSIAFVIEKGGTGKSTIAFNIGWYLSKKHKVLFLDLDGQMANLTYFCGVSKEGILTIGNILDGDADLESAAVNVKPNLHIIPADNSITGIGTPAHFDKLSESVELKTSQDYQLFLIERMQEFIRSACEHYDYVLLDPNPSPNYLHTLALCSCEYVIIPVLPDAASVVSDEGTAESLDIVRETGINEDVRVLGILFNRYTDRTNLSKQVRKITEDFAREMGTTIFKNTIRNSVVLSECVGMHTGITDYRPSSPAAEDVRKVAAEIKRRMRNGH
ncbi:MAG: ParA family protein [Mogibacterium sp.]|nr:ParA family protein [Mogibacterium sp.]MBQ6623446.1 ParA family protein [Mogibacterium sp.]